MKRVKPRLRTECMCRDTMFDSFTDIFVTHTQLYFLALQYHPLSLLLYIFVITVESKESTA